MSDTATAPSATPAAPPPPVDRATLRLAAFVGGLALALVAGFGLGRVVTTSGSSRPSDTAPAADHTHAPGTGPHDHGSGGTGTTARAGAEAGGLGLSGSGYTLVPTATELPAGARHDLQFRIVGADRKPVTTFAVVHDKPLHLIVARRDLSGYQHLHPTMAPDGTWSVPLVLPQPGIWRAYADFTAVDATGTQTALTLGVDLVAAGTYAPRALPAPAKEATTDGFTVRYEGTPQVGAVAPVLFHVLRDGAPVTGLERYLGAYGHLVVLREGDLGYVHVHPEEQMSGGAVKFWLALPSPGRYRMFFDFQVAGAVHTAGFTVTVA
ncbi:hypothetical protein [Micromonospora sp. NPDC049679]|uniref:hypothetical protein n=1 Tax=Micromonospora sp. NPDC049679 TaxID=3155920 RepID=UPI0033E52827